MKPQDFALSNFAQACGQCSSLKPRVDRIAGLRVRALKVQQIAGLLAHAGAAQSHASRCERAQTSSQRERWVGGWNFFCNPAHELKSLSG